MAYAKAGALRPKVEWRADKRADWRGTAAADSWTWMHAKGIAQPSNEGKEFREWLTLSAHRRPRRRSKAQPTKMQAATERVKALRDVTTHTENSLMLLQNNSQVHSDSDSGSSGFMVTGVIKGPDVTPQTAFDL
ncbi:hypothetical protein NDU88_001573 [Pleurodeles waltl]|uniref:Uncharacterized protein n=1 Tax=Pleurodeles waltl TaxID=8319 RepID=A0AAV7LYZ9_PLEWA|nr:hypothetical protein NDU88_001573 [Pleurodeles waltl]